MAGTGGQADLPQYRSACNPWRSSRRSCASDRVRTGMRAGGRRSVLLQPHALPLAGERRLVRCLPSPIRLHGRNPSTAEQIDPPASPDLARNYGRTTEAGDGVRTHDPQLGKPILGRRPSTTERHRTPVSTRVSGTQTPAARGMCEGAGRSTCSWMLEPGEYRWELVREGDDVEVRIRDAGGRFRSGVVRQQVRLREFVRAVVSALEGVGSEDVEFLKDWLAGGTSETAV